VGQPGTGKSTFLHTFARLYADRLLALPAAGSSGANLGYGGSYGGGERGLSVAVQYDFAFGQRGRGVVRLIDTAGLPDGLPSQAFEREWLVGTLKTVYVSDVVLHMMDAAEAGDDLAVAVAEVDRVLAAYGQGRPGYALLANKMDLPAAQWGLLRLRETFPHNYIIPVSALQGTGFRLVEGFLARQF